MKLLVLLAMLATVPAYAANEIVPNPVLTPGSFHNPPMPLRRLCAVGYTKTVRNVPLAVKREVFRRYGYDLSTTRMGDYEIDHVGSLELDGTNDISNLWPQSYRTLPLNAYRKDVLEGALKRLVCAGRMPLQDAQREITTDWPSAYQRYVLGTIPELARR